MKVLGATSTAILSLLLAVAAPVWAQEQHEQEQKDKPAQREEKKAQPAKSAKQSEKPAVQQQNAKPQEQKAQQPAKSAKPEVKSAQQHTTQAQPQKQQHAGRGHIPDDRFKANFGQEHRFRVSQSDYGNRRFQYGGYSFGFVDAWPSNWLYTQDVYVVEIDGVYYLCNAMYPGVNLALSITL